jgi:hypothetical protein
MSEICEGNAIKREVHRTLARLRLMLECVGLLNAGV